MNKQEIYAFLAAKGLWHEITEHRAVYTMAELSDIAVPYPEADAKNLFVRDDKKQNYLLRKNAECVGRDLSNSDIWHSNSFDKGE